MDTNTDTNTDTNKKLTDNEVLNLAMKCVTDSLSGGIQAITARKQIIVLSERTFQVCSPDWIDGNTPVWLVDFYPSGGYVVFNNTGKKETK